MAQGVGCSIAVCRRGGLAHQEFRMASRRSRPISLPAPYLRWVWLDPSQVRDPQAYPFCLPFLSDAFELDFDRAVTVIVGENGMGKSTLLEGIAKLAGFDEAGGASGYKPVDHSDAIEAMGGRLSSVTIISFEAGPPST